MMTSVGSLGGEHLVLVIRMSAKACLVWLFHYTTVYRGRVSFLLLRLIDRSISMLVASGALMRQRQ